MFKKVSLVFFSALWFCSIFLLIYRLVEPDTAIDQPSDVVVATSPNYLTTPVINNIENTNQTKYYYFCTTNHQDCSYMNDVLLKNLAAQMNIDSFEFLEFVDVVENYGDLTPTKLKQTWGFENYPALVAAKDLGNEFEILNVIEWTQESPLDEKAIKDWMILNELWDGPVEETGELIDKPINE